MRQDLDPSVSKDRSGEAEANWSLSSWHEPQYIGMLGRADEMTMISTLMPRGLSTSIVVLEPELVVVGECSWCKSVTSVRHFSSLIPKCDMLSSSAVQRVQARAPFRHRS